MEREEIQREFEVNATIDMRQLDIPFEPKKLARTTDPSTSKRAANQANGFVGKHHRAILAALCLIPDGTAYEIAGQLTLEVAAVFRRLNELERVGKIYTTGERRGPTGRMCRVWRAV